MTKRVHLGGFTNTTLHLETDGTITVEEKQDAQDILDRNQRGRDHRFDANSPEGFVQEVAEIPMVSYLAECRKAGCAPYSAEAELVLERMLVDPQYAKFLSAPKVRDAHVIIKGVR